MRVPPVYSMGLLAAALLGQAVTLPALGHTMPSNLQAFTSPMNSTQAALVRSQYSNETAKSEMHRPRLTMVNNVGEGAKGYIICSHRDSVSFADPHNTDGGWIALSTLRQGPIPEDIIGFDLGAMGHETSFTFDTFVYQCRVYGGETSIQHGMVIDVNNVHNHQQPAGGNPNDPSYLKSYGFAEFNYDTTMTCVNPSNVDFAGLSMGVEAITNDNSVHPPAGGLKPHAKENICAELERVSTDSAPWSKCCVRGNNGVTRVLAPNMVMGGPDHAFEGHYDEYHQQVMEKYSQEDLTILGRTCRIDPVSKTLSCSDGSFTSFDPKAWEIFTCQGTFQPPEEKMNRGIMEQLCSAYNRGTLLLPGGEVQPSLSADLFYTNDCHNAYAKAVHMYTHNMRGYAFPKDDIPGAGSGPHEEQAGLICTGVNNLDQLKIYIGGANM